MPVYEYKCEKCGHRFEVEQRVGETPVSRCRGNGCRGRVMRVFSAPAIVFKGKGFHATDYGRGSSRKAAPTCPSGACATCPAAKGE